MRLRAGWLQLVERLYFRPGDFPQEPLDSVLKALQADVVDKTAELQEQLRDARRSPVCCQ